MSSIEFNKGVDWIVRNLREDKEVKIHYVFSRDREKALSKIDELINGEFVVKSIISKDEATFECLCNIYKFKSPNEGARAIRCNTAHIDNEIYNNNRWLVDNVLIRYAVKGDEKERVFYF